MKALNLILSHSVKVLIDTWWNVNNLQNIPSHNKEIRFNRYMVECEFFRNWFRML